MDVFEAMGTARAMRWFRPDPVPEELIEQMLWAATRASSPNNTQGWAFVVVTDADQRARIGQALAPFAAVIETMATPEAATDRRTLAGAQNLAARMAEVPVIVFVCGTNIYPPHRPSEPFMYSAVYAASQNLVVAARALELGAAFTTLHNTAEAQIREILGVPDDYVIGCTIPVGYPAGPTGEVSRRPLAEVVHRDRW